MAPTISGQIWAIARLQANKFRGIKAASAQAREEYSRLMLMAAGDLADKKNAITFRQFIEETYLPWYKTQVKESTYLNRKSTIQKHFAYFYKKTVGGIEPLDVQN